MNSGGSDDGSTSRGTAQFATTHWSVVIAAGQSSSPAAQEALERLCRTYWPPLYAYERQWATTLLQSVLFRLEQEHASAGTSDLCRALQTRVWGTDDAEPYAQLAQRLGQNEGVIRTAAHHLRHRYGDLLREEIAHTVVDAKEIDDELRHLITVLGRNA